MRELDVRRQSDSARRYLDLAAPSSALRTTLFLAAESVTYPVAAVNILDEHEQHTLISVGTAPPPPQPRSATPCDVVVRTGQPLAISDLPTRGYPQQPCVGTAAARSYIGIPLVGREGLVVGTLALVDVAERHTTEQALRRLVQFGSVLEEQLDLLRRVGPSRPQTDVYQLAVAIDEGQILPYFQPLVHLATGEVVAYEALARWHHPTRGVLPPAEFIPLAEDSELIIDLDLAVLRQAAVVAQRWRQTSPELRITVNVSGRHFEHPGCVDRIHDAVTASGLPPSAVSLELTETAAIAASPANVAFLDQLRALGFRIVLDDFGSGVSTLEHLVYLPCDGVKIDRSTAAALHTRSGAAVVRAIAGLAVELGKTVVLEGLETVDQAERALELGCMIGQGYLWSEPQPEDVLVG
ncbi:EAL domain-containing protein [Rhodococcus sp. X156]|uniref:sensor domain-containing phosphodiesterase n=1 Tax=Rhodococcus sp. X156 TaxID=2499145 RepID=UPI000FDBCCD5|nr:EAL domain-containing protein [Rhodococcus sp. X156]